MPVNEDSIVLDSLTADPASPSEGEVWFNSTEGRFKVSRGGTTRFLCDKEQQTCYGDHFQDAEALTVVTTTSTAFSSLLAQTFQLPTTGRYKLDWSYIWNHNSASNDHRVQITQDGTVVMDHQQEPKDSSGTFGSTGANQKHPESGFLYIDAAVAGSSIDIVVQHATSSGGVNSSTWDVRLALYKVRD